MAVAPFEHRRETLEDGDHEVAHVDIDVPRDRDGSFEPQIVHKRQGRDGVVVGAVQTM